MEVPPIFMSLIRFTQKQIREICENALRRACMQRWRASYAQLTACVLRRDGLNYDESMHCCTRTSPPHQTSGSWNVGHARVKVRYVAGTDLRSTHSILQIGSGKKTYEAGKELLKRWGMFQLGWAQVGEG